MFPREPVAAPSQRPDSSSRLSFSSLEGDEEVFLDTESTHSIDTNTASSRSSRIPALQRGLRTESGKDWRPISAGAQLECPNAANGSEPELKPLQNTEELVHTFSARLQSTRDGQLEAQSDFLSRGEVSLLGFRDRPEQCRLVLAIRRLAWWEAFRNAH